MWSLTSQRERRTSGAENFQSSAKKDFFNTIGTKRPFGRLAKSANANLQTSAPNRSSSIKSVQILASWLLGNRNRKVNSLNPLSAAETPFLIECFAYPRALLLQIPHRR